MSLKWHRPFTKGKRTTPIWTSKGLWFMFDSIHSSCLSVSLLIIFFKAWQFHTGIRIEGPLLTCVGMEKCAECGCQPGKQHWPGARYLTALSSGFPHFEVSDSNITNLWNYRIWWEIWKENIIYTYKVRKLCRVKREDHQRCDSMEFWENGTWAWNFFSFDWSSMYFPFAERFRV